MSYLKYIPSLIEQYNKIVSDISTDDDYDVENFLPNDFLYYGTLCIIAFVVLFLVSMFVSWFLKKVAVMLGNFLFFVLAIGTAIMGLKLVGKYLGVSPEIYLENIVKNIFPTE